MEHMHVPYKHAHRCTAHNIVAQLTTSLHSSQLKRLDTHMDDTHMEAAGGLLGAAGG